MIGWLSGEGLGVRKLLISDLAEVQPRFWKEYWTRSPR